MIPCMKREVMFNKEITYFKRKRQITELPKKESKSEGNLDTFVVNKQRIFSLLSCQVVIVNEDIQLHEDKGIPMK